MSRFVENDSEDVQLSLDDFYIITQMRFTDFSHEIPQSPCGVLTVSMKITCYFEGPINGCNPVWFPAVDKLAYLLLFPIIQISVAIMRSQSIRLCTSLLSFSLTLMV